MYQRINTGKTAEQRRAEAEQLQASIAVQVEQLRDSEAWTRFLRFAAAFHSYSLNNVLLILAQMPGASHVAGYKTWQKLGRQVRKGEHGIRIFGGRNITTTTTDDGDDEGGEQATRRHRVFFPVSVFDISQTDLIDPTAEDPSTVAHRLTGDDPAGIYQAVADYLTGQGWTVGREPIPGAVNGFTTLDGTRRVVVDAGLAPAQAAKTILHEAAHVVCHTSQDPADYVAHRGVQETEAESVAYIVAALLGLDTAAYSIGYVAGWSGCDTDLIKNTATNVLKAAHVICDAITQD